MSPVRYREGGRIGVIRERYAMDPQHTDPTTPTSGSLPRSGLSIAALVLGIIALLTSFLPIINNLSAFLAFIGLILGIIGMVGIAKGKKGGKGMGIAALIICVLSIVIVLATQRLYSAALNNASVSVTAGSSSTASASASSSSSSESADYTIADETLDKSNSYMPVITGTLTNNGTTDKSYVGITYNLYDADGNQIGNAYANTNNLKAGSTWKFQATCTVDASKIAKFERAEVTGW